MQPEVWKIIERISSTSPRTPALEILADFPHSGPPWNYSNSAVAIMNVPTLIGATLGCIYGGWFSDIFVRWVARKRGGVSEAEDRLLLMFLSAVINPAGLMLFGIASDKALNWPAAYVGLGMVGFGFGCAGDISMAYLMDAYVKPKYGRFRECLETSNFQLTPQMSP